MNETHQQLIQIGSRILSASRNELYLSMRFLDVALSSLRYEMNLSSLYVGTDGEKILFNPRYLIQRSLSDRVLVNRAYLHMLLHCLFRHPFHQGDRDEEYWNLACDIAVESMVDALPFKSVHLVVSDRRNEWYDKLRRELKVLSAEGIYEVLQKEKLSIQDFGKLQLEFWVDDHVFWEKKKDDDQNQDENQDDNNNQNQNDQNDEQEQVEEIVIAIDTSESCEGEVVRKFLEETYAILRQNESFFHTFHIHIIQCDTVIQQDKVITSAEEMAAYMEEFDLRGSGGTDFRPVFTYVSKLIEEKVFRNLKGLIYFTDGWGQFPKRRPPYETAFVFFDEGMYNEREVPPWAMKVILGKEDLEISYNKE